MCVLVVLLYSYLIVCTYYRSLSILDQDWIQNVCWSYYFFPPVHPLSSCVLHCASMYLSQCQLSLVDCDCVDSLGSDLLLRSLSPPVSPHSLGSVNVCRFDHRSHVHAHHWECPNAVRISCCAWIQYIEREFSVDATASPVYSFPLCFLSDGSAEHPFLHHGFPQHESRDGDSLCFRFLQFAHGLQLFL